MPTPSTLFSLIWSLWAGSWIAAALWSAPTVRRRLSRRLGLTYGLIGASILVPMVWRLLGWPATRGYDIGILGADALAFATIPGFAFCWWARVHLGTLWSVEVAAKAGHRIVRSGPYALVRHPIYTGILWAALVTDIAGATVPSALSLACLALGFWLKARIEERFLADSVDRAAYAAYRRDVPMLLPVPLARRPT